MISLSVGSRCNLFRNLKLVKARNTIPVTRTIPETNGKFQNTGILYPVYFPNLRYAPENTFRVALHAADGSNRNNLCAVHQTLPVNKKKPCRHVVFFKSSIKAEFFRKEYNDETDDLYRSPPGYIPQACSHGWLRHALWFFLPGMNSIENTRLDQKPIHDNNIHATLHGWRISGC